MNAPYSLLIIATLAVLTSCRTTKSLKPIKHARTIIKETLRDTVVHVAAEQSSLQAVLGCDSVGAIYIKEVLSVDAKKRAKAPKVQIKDQVLKVDCLCDSMGIYLKLKNTHITDMLQETVYVPTEKPLSAWQQVQLWLGRVLLIALVGGGIILIMLKKIV